MANYSSALNMPYNAWVARQAAIEEISPSDLEKTIEIVPIKVTGIAFLGLPTRRFTLKRFDELAEEFEAITDFRECLVSPGILGFFGREYVVSGTGIKRK